MKRTVRILSAALLILVAIYFLGPVPDYPAYDNSPLEARYSSSKIEVQLANQSADVRPGNESFVYWADSGRQTEYSIVYLHGFSAGPMEGDPVHRNLARNLGYNLYVPRLAAHGLRDSNAFEALTPSTLIESAKEAIAVGKSIGKKVIVIGTSTGATYGIYLAANDPDIAGLVLLSPNIALEDPAAFLLDMPWGRQIAELVFGSAYRHIDYPENARPYWYSDYHIDGIIALQRMLDETMTTETFKKIEVPVYLGYYYKNEEERDNVVSIDAMHEFFQAVSTPDDKKEIQAFANAGNHVISSNLKNENWKEVQDSVEVFVKGKILERE